MLEVTTIGSHNHVGSQALNKVRHRLFNVFSWQLFPDGVQGSFNSSVVLGFGWGLWCFCNMTPRHDSPDALVQWVQI